MWCACNVTFSSYLYDPLFQLNDQIISRHMNMDPIGILSELYYADEITLLGWTRMRNNVIVLLDVCRDYALDHGILFNPKKTTYFHFPCHKDVFDRGGGRGGG